MDRCKYLDVRDFLPEWTALRLPKGRGGPGFLGVPLADLERLPRTGRRYWVHPETVGALVELEAFEQQYQRAMLKLGLAGHLNVERIPVWVDEGIPRGEVWWSLRGLDGDGWLQAHRCPAPRPADWEERMEGALRSIPRVEDL